MLFGRRKPGFAKEVENLEIPEEINEDELKELDEFKIDDNFEKKDLLEYLNEEEDEEVKKDSLDKLEEAEVKEIPREIVFANYVRKRSMGAYLTNKKDLEKEEENLEDLLEKLKKNDSCKDIVSIVGDKDRYFYSREYMSDNYANIAMLVEEKDLAKTIAELVRWNCESYPCATPLYYFKNSPYFYKDPQIERALSIIKRREEYEDIQELTTGNNIRYLYSTIHMSEKYARALAEGVEYGEYGYRNKT